MGNIVKMLGNPGKLLDSIDDIDGSSHTTPLGNQAIQQ
jgi:hypothetical protein